MIDYHIYIFIVNSRLFQLFHNLSLKKKIDKTGGVNTVISGKNYLKKKRNKQALNVRGDTLHRGVCTYTRIATKRT